MRVEKFKLTDYAKIRLANGAGLEHWNLTEGVLPLLYAMERGSFWTFWEGEEPVVICGFWPLNERTCEVSFFPSESFITRPLSGYRAARKILKGVCETFQRVQANCRAEGCFLRFAETLGFREEGRMRGFGRDGGDHLMLAIVR